jgi:hypothetical protein
METTLLHSKLSIEAISIYTSYVKNAHQGFPIRLRNKLLIKNTA